MEHSTEYWKELIKAHEKEIKEYLTGYAKEIFHPANTGTRTCVFLCEDGKIRENKGLTGRHGGLGPFQYLGGYIELAEFHAPTCNLTKYDEFSHLQLTLEATVDVGDFECYKKCDFARYLKESENPVVRWAASKYSGVSETEMRTHLEQNGIPVDVMEAYKQSEKTLKEFSKLPEHKGYFRDCLIRYMSEKELEAISVADEAWKNIAKQYNLAG